MNILITGAAGGIGSTLSLHLTNRGHKIFALDNLNNGYLNNLKEHDNFFCEFILDDIRNTDALKKHLKLNNIETIIHMAAITSLPECESDPVKCIDVNVAGSVSVLNAAREMGQKVIMASTSAIYENNNRADAPFSESLNVNPTLYYSLSKKMMEDCIKSYIQNYNMPITTLRFFNVFGPRQDIYRKSPPLINYIVRQIKNKEKAIFFSDGKQVRDYVHVDDVVSMIELCLTNPKNEVFNVCTSTLTSVIDIIEYAEKAFNIKLEHEFVDSKDFWKNYDNLFRGSFPFKKQILEKEVNKYSLGSLRKSSDIMNWNPNVNIESLMIKTMRENFEKYIINN